MAYEGCSSRGKTVKHSAASLCARLFDCLTVCLACRPFGCLQAAGVLPGFLESETTRRQALGWMEAQRWETLTSKMVELGELTPEGKAKAGTLFYNPPLVETAGASTAGSPQPDGANP